MYNNMPNNGNYNNINYQQFAQCPLQFKNNNQNKAVGVLLIVMGSIVGSMLLISGIALLSESISAALFLLITGAAGLILFIMFGLGLLSQSSKTDMRIQYTLRTYSMAYLVNEINTNTIATYVNPYDKGTVYFTENFIIATSEGVFTYGEIKEARASRSRSRYQIIDNYMGITLQNGDTVSLCHARGETAKVRARFVEYVNICMRKNPTVVGDVKSIFRGI